MTSEAYNDHLHDELAFFGEDDHHAAAGMTTKIPPSFDGRTSWFAFEEQIDDWVDLTTLEPVKHGPALKNALRGEAATYKPLLDRDALRDPQRGVQYFKDTLRVHFVKGSQSVFLWRFFQLLRSHRGQMDFVRWIGKFTVTRKRVTDAWMDLLPDPIATDPQYAEFFHAVNARRATVGEEPFD